MLVDNIAHDLDLCLRGTLSVERGHLDIVPGTAFALDSLQPRLIVRRAEVVGHIGDPDFVGGVGVLLDFVADAAHGAALRGCAFRAGIETDSFLDLTASQTDRHHHHYGQCGDQFFHAPVPPDKEIRFQVRKKSGANFV